MLKLVKRGQVWHITGTVRGVRERSSTGTASRPHAEAVLARRTQEILDRSIYGERATATWAEAVNLYLDLGGEARYLTPLTERWGAQRLASITALEVARAARDLYPGAAPSTLDRQLYTPTIAVLRAAAEAGLCPVPKLRRPRVKRAMIEAPPDDWIGALLDAGPRTTWKPGSRGEKRFQAARARLRALVLVITTTGARVSEAVDIRWRHCDPDAGEALLRHTKNGAPRRILLTPETATAIRALPHGGPDDRVLGYASRYSASQALERAAAGAGIAHFSSHQVGRHAFAARLLANGQTLKTVQEAGGWSDITIVARNYGHLERSATDAAVLAAGTKLTQRPTPAPAKVLTIKRK